MTLHITLFLEFFCNIFSTIFLIKLPTNLSYTIHLFYKKNLQSLTKKSFIVAEKNNLHTLIIIIL